MTSVKSGIDEKDRQRVRAERQMKVIEERNKLLRLKWFEKNYKNVYCNPKVPKEKIPRKAEVLYNELQKLRQEKADAQEKLDLLVEKPPKVVKISDSEYLKRGPMYPVLDEIKETLYEGKSVDFMINKYHNMVSFRELTWFNVFI